MNREVTVAMVALGGYGNFYLRALFAEAEAHDVKLVAGIDPNPITCRHLEQFEQAHIPTWSSSLPRSICTRRSRLRRLSTALTSSAKNR